MTQSIPPEKYLIYGKNQDGLLSIGTACVATLAGLLAPSPVKAQ
jgi:hypothetical protein